MLVVGSETDNAAVSWSESEKVGDEWVQCCSVVTDRMRVVGELPSLSLNISDSRLCDILSLVSSIPLPQPAPPPPIEDEDLQLVTTDELCRFSKSKRCQHSLCDLH